MRKCTRLGFGNECEKTLTSRNASKGDRADGSRPWPGGAKTPLRNDQEEVVFRTGDVGDEEIKL